MSISFECQECGKSLKVKDENAGRKTRCPGCQAVVKIPEAEAVEDWELEADVEELPAPKSKRAAGSTKASAPRSAKTRDVPAPLPARPKKKSTKDAQPAAKSGGIPLWIIIGGSVMGVLSIAAVVLVAMNLSKLQGSARNAAAQEPQWVPTETYSKIGKFKMLWEMPPKWTQESGLEDEIWPWANMKGQGQTIKLASNRSLTEMSSTMTSIGGRDEMLMTAHTVRIAKLKAENTDYDETKPAVYQGTKGPVVWSDYEYKGVIGKGYGIRCTIIGPRLPCTLTMECSQSARDKWRPVLLHIAGSVTYKLLKDDDEEGFNGMPLDPGGDMDDDGGGVLE